jgi:hypothetical protein
MDSYPEVDLFKARPAIFQQKKTPMKIRIAALKLESRKSEIQERRGCEWMKVLMDEQHLPLNLLVAGLYVHDSDIK